MSICHDYMVIAFLQTEAGALGQRESPRGEACWSHSWPENVQLTSRKSDKYMVAIQNP